MSRKAARHIVGVVTLHQRGRYWHVEYSIDGVRTRQALKVTNLKVAQQKAREIDERIQQGDHHTLLDLRENKNTTFSELVAQFNEKYKDWSEATKKSNKGMVEALVEEWGEMAAPKINAAMIEARRARRMDQDGITNATANRELACVKVIFKMAVRWGIVALNPARDVTMLKEAPKIPEALTEDQVGKLLEKLPDYARRVVIVAVDTGNAARGITAASVG